MSPPKRKRWRASPEIQEFIDSVRFVLGLPPLFLKKTKLDYLKRKPKP